MKQIRFSEEVAYLLGILFMALGVACVSCSNFGYSMIVAPVYLIFTKLDGILSFGTVEYLFQGALLILMCLIVRRFRWQYLFSFVTAVIYGYTFDLALWLIGHIPATAMSVRVLLFVIGTLCISVSVTLFVRTYLAPEVYELFVRELADRFGMEFGAVKLAYDCTGCVVSIGLSVILFGFGVFADFSFAKLGAAIVDGYVLEGIGIGTVVAALVNGPLITLCGKRFDRCFVRVRILSDKTAAILSASSNESGPPSP